jgi:hypothetical protein
VAINRGRPAQQTIGRTENHDHHAIARIAGLHSCTHAQTSCATRRQRRRYRRKAADTPGSQRARVCPALHVGVGTAGENVEWEIDPLRRRLPNLDRPHLATDRLQIGRIVDVLVTQKFGPRAVGRVREVVRRPLALAVPPSGRLRRVFPQKRIARVHLAEGDHVAGVMWPTW